MSQLLDRYLYAVRRHLPSHTDADVTAELGDTLQSRFDEEAARLGRPLTVTEEAAILRDVGRPVAVAGRYGQVPYVVGPALYPYFRATLRALGATGVPLVAVAAVVTALTADAPLRAVLGVVGTALNAAWAVFGIVTLIFWQMGRATPAPRFDDDWEPSELPETPTELRAVPRTVSISHAFFLAVYLLWWMGVLPLTRWLRLVPAGPGAPELAPVWHTLFASIAAVLAIELVIHVVNAWRPEVPTWRRVAHMACDVVALGIIYVLVNADAVIVAPSAGSWGGLVPRLDDVARTGLVGLSALIVVGLIDDGKRLFGWSSGQGRSWKAALAMNGRALRTVRGLRDLRGGPGPSRP